MPTGARAKLCLLLFALTTSLILILVLSQSGAHSLTQLHTQRSQAVQCSNSYNQTEFFKMSKSLNGEETILHDQYFKGICGGTYVELGAHDGIGQDNTLAFHKVLGWSGLLVTRAEGFIFPATLTKDSSQPLLVSTLCIQ